MRRSSSSHNHHHHISCFLAKPWRMAINVLVGCASPFIHTTSHCFLASSTIETRTRLICMETSAEIPSQPSLIMVARNVSSNTLLVFPIAFSPSSLSGRRSTSPCVVQGCVKKCRWLQRNDPITRASGKEIPRGTSVRYLTSDIKHLRGKNLNSSLLPCSSI